MEISMTELVDIILTVAEKVKVNGYGAVNGNGHHNSNGHVEVADALEDCQHAEFIRTLPPLEDMQPTQTTAKIKGRPLKTFGARLQKAREAAMFTQSELAAMLGTSQMGIAYIEKSINPCRWTRKRLEQAARILKVSPAHLTGEAQQ